jgi:Ca-activated chloride channel family protein
MRTRMSVVVVVVWILVALASAQSDRAEISGTVVDTAGFVLPGVNVTLSGEENRSTVTDERGRYSFTNVRPGNYEVRFELVGFVTVANRVTASAGRPARLNARLALAALTETVTITGESPERAQQRSDTGVSSGLGVGSGGGTGGGIYPIPSAAPVAVGRMPLDRNVGPFNTEAYDHIDENGLRRVANDPLSTFSVDVDTASYANVRRFLMEGSLPPAGAVRIEELINYFRFEYPQPASEVPFSITTEVSESPWNPKHRLALIGIQGRALEDREPAPRNLVFLIDVSGSMMPADKLPLVRNAMRMLANVLTARDRVAIVVYAGASGLVLPSTPGDQKATIHHAIAHLESGGSTNGAAGIRLAYKVAREHFIRGGVNRVVLATDGDFNVGVTSQDELVRLIEQERTSGVFLSVLGVGTGNLKDSTMERLADKGNGNYAYLDSLYEARKVLVREAGGTLVTIAKDVKIQIEFNPKAVSAYRLIGYENRVLRNEDFKDDKKDAGEIGSGHSVTALYEIIPAGEDVGASDVDPLKYQTRPATRARDASEVATVNVRYKAPDGDTSRLVSAVIRNRVQPMSGNLAFASAVAEFGMLLRESDYRGRASYESTASRARAHRGSDPEGYRTEFVKLVDLAASLKR